MTPRQPSRRSPTAPRSCRGGMTADAGGPTARAAATGHRRHTDTVHPGLGQRALPPHLRPRRTAPQGQDAPFLLSQRCQHLHLSSRQPMPDLGDPHRRRFDPATAAQLFERFYRSDTSRTASSAGSAIGLTIAKAINQAHHGQLLGCSDGLGTGARFEITLPIAGRPAPTRAG